MKKCIVLLAVLFLLTGCTAPAKTPTEPAVTPAVTTLPTEPSSAPTEPAPEQIPIMDLVGTWEQVWAEVEGDRNEVDPGRYLLQITGENENSLSASYLSLDYPDKNYTDKALIPDAREMYPGCGNDSWVVDLDYTDPFDTTYTMTLLESGELMVQSHFFYDQTIPVVSYACFARSERDVSQARTQQLMDASNQFFAVAYLGYMDAEPQGGLMDWIAAENPQLLQQCPFIAQIPQDRIIGTVGDVFCVVPRWNSSSIAVNQVVWNGSDYETEKVLYRAEVGEPILLTVDSGAFAPVILLSVTEDDSSVLWYPGLDDANRVGLPYDGEEALALDISLYESIHPDLYQLWFDSGYLYPTKTGLENTSWTASGTFGGRENWLFLDLNEDGSARFEWAWKDEAATQAVYTGTWDVFFENRGFLKLDLTDENGKKLSDVFVVLIDMSGECLVLDSSAEPAPLPIDVGIGEVLAVFELSVG